jgi:KDO2-lipid IV(A) lauroyltransferase
MGGGRSWWNNAGINNGRVFRWTCAGVATLPRQASYAIGWMGTAIAYRAMGDVSRALAENLQRVRPDLSCRELDRLALATYRSYAVDVIDFIRSLSLSPGERDRLFILEGRERFDAARSAGRGLILVTGHFGNWELGAVMMHHFGYPLAVVAMQEPDPVVNDIRRRMRGSLGVRTIEVRQALDTALQIRRHLAENATVAMLMDRHVGRDRVRVRFFDRDAWFLRTPALMGYLSGAPLVPCFIERQPDGRFLVLPGAPIHVDRALERDMAVRHAAQAFASVLEARIRERPTLWYQFYPYWRAQDAASAETAGTAIATATPGLKSRCHTLPSRD